MRWLVRLAAVVLTVAAIREVHHRREAVVAMGEDLNDDAGRLHDAESEIDATDREIDDAEDRIRELGTQISALEREPGGVPSSRRDDYARLIGEHNDAVALHNDLVARQRRLNTDYRADVDRHNARVADANAYATASSRPCALLPDWLASRLCAPAD